MSKKKLIILTVIIVILLIPKPYKTTRQLSINELLGMPVYGGPTEKGFCLGIIYPKKYLGWECLGYKAFKSITRSR